MFVVLLISGTSPAKSVTDEDDHYDSDQLSDPESGLKIPQWTVVGRRKSKRFYHDRSVSKH